MVLRFVEYPLVHPNIHACSVESYRYVYDMILYACSQCSKSTDRIDQVWISKLGIYLENLNQWILFVEYYIYLLIRQTCCCIIVHLSSFESNQYNLVLLFASRRHTGFDHLCLRF